MNYKLSLGYKQFECSSNLRDFIYFTAFSIPPGDTLHTRYKVSPKSRVSKMRTPDYGPPDIIRKKKLANHLAKY